MPQFSPAAMLTTLAIVMFPVLAADARAQLLLEVDGVELHGRARLVMSGAGSCNVLETDTSYEEYKANHGAPMDVWRLDFSVRNGSGRWLDHLIAHFGIDSEWPDCTNWSGPDVVQLRDLNPEVPLKDIWVAWSGSHGVIQETGRNVVAPNETLTDTEFFIVLRGDPEPQFTNWSMDFDFGSDVESTPEQDRAFWRLVQDSTNPDNIESYLTYFPNGEYAQWAEQRLADLRAGGWLSPLDATPPSPSRPASSAALPPASTAQENLFWQSIMTSTNPAMFEAYLAQFPSGVFRALAEARLAELRAPATNVPAAAGSRRVDAAGSPGSGSRTAGGRDAPSRPGEVFRDCDGCPEMVVMPGGGLALGRYEVTVGEYRAFAGATGGGAGDCGVGVGSWRNPLFPQTDRHPVVCASWDDAQAYVLWLGRTAGAEYRLPAEAEWERAASGSQRGCDSERTGIRGTCPVGSYGSNAAGLSDMVGNVWEWTEDCLGSNCGRRVLRGGSWGDFAGLQRPGARARDNTDVRSSYGGFRVARTLD